MVVSLRIRKFSSAIGLAACAAAAYSVGAQETVRATSRPLPHKDPEVATIVGVLVPGGGQFYATRYGKAAGVFLGTAAAVAIAVDAANNDCSGGGPCHQHSIETIGVVTAALIWGYGWATAANDARMYNTQRLNTTLAPVLHRGSNGRLLAGLQLTTP